MNKVLLLIIMMFFLTSSYSQDQKEFIEVIVEDSLEVEPEEIFYMVVLSSPITTSDTSYLENTPATKIPSSSNNSELDKFYKLIKRMQIDTLTVSELNISNYDYDA